MILSIISAVGKNRVIGAKNQLVWHLSNDLKHFKETTMGKPIIMGANTFKSIGKALPGRKNIVIATDPDFDTTGCEVVPSFGEAIDKVRDDEEVFVIGGGRIYSIAFPFAQKMYLTLVDASPEGDVFFPEWNENEWQLLSSEEHKADEKNEYDHKFNVYQRKK